MPNIDVTNPGDVNVANQGDGRLSVNQPVTTGPGTNPGPLVQAGSREFGFGTEDPDQPVTVTPSTNAGPLVQAGTASPTKLRTLNVITNDVVQQVYGAGSPKNVFV